ncbi:YqgE/AlgH family protein [Belliella kenyensis]|uniref:YqgE/AlgH family protein n=1 Tax=Belliella kenyensis TaxID=1472724 RepID=A0ABV8ELW0_9BACT|nr:YqgE/AlgH family protein [Belliella kenyensis]MCH7400432.1 YqgE/AlgH family protein [Belliella kenyensis]MDN3604551.1 YqgE/AlgH family protein [Belliella kenyensis]
MEENAQNQIKPGTLLISEPFLQDENFVRSVVLLCENSKGGSFGLVLNKLSILKVSELIDRLSFLDSDVYVGGPVEQNTFHFIYFGERMLDGSVPLGNNLWWGGDFSQLEQKIINSEVDLEYVRFFIGYSGWSEGQLEEEIAEKTWIHTPCTETESIFKASPEELWRIILKNMGGEYQIMANYPIDPRLN